MQDFARQGSQLGLCASAQRMEVQGHRGIEGFPNNTLESFDGGLRAGADRSELDLQVTKDNKIIVAHDPTLDPKRCGLSGGQALSQKVLRQMSLQEAKAVHCAESSLSPTASTALMPTLSEVFAHLKNQKSLNHNPAKLNIEIKYDKNHPEYFPSRDEFADLVIKEIKAGGWSNDRMIVQSFDYDILKIVKAKDPSITIVPLIGNAEDAVKVAKELKSSVVTVSFTQLTPAIVAELHRMHVQVIPWTVDTDKDMRQMISLGVEGIITNRADQFVKIRKELCGN